MATIDLGRLGFVNKGTYNNSTTYEKNDLVQFTDGGILSTYLYIDSTAQSGQAPSSSGTAGSRWVYYAKGVADAVASAGNNKVLVTNASGNLTPLAIGSAGQVLKTNSGANGFEFGQGGLIKQVVTHTDTTDYTLSVTGNSTPTAGATLGTITPTSTSSKIICNFFVGIIAGPDNGPSGTFIQIFRSINGGSYSTVAETNGTIAGGGGSRNVFSGDWDLTGDANRGISGGFGATFVDTSYNSTNAVAYKLYVGCGDSGSYTYYINRPKNGFSATYNNGSRTTSVLTEV